MVLTVLSIYSGALNVVGGGEMKLFSSVGSYKWKVLICGFLLYHAQTAGKFLRYLTQSSVFVLISN